MARETCKQVENCFQLANIISKVTVKEKEKERKALSTIHLHIFYLQNEAL